MTNFLFSVYTLYFWHTSITSGILLWREYLIRNIQLSDACDAIIRDEDSFV